MSPPPHIVAMSRAGIIGESKQICDAFEKIYQYAKNRNIPITSVSETGTGKELVAAYIHAVSDRRDGPIVVAHIAGLPETLVDSELFGHKKGAFTGADKDREGLIARANGGTVVVDEVADIPERILDKLIRFFDTGEFRRVGDDRPTRADVRFVFLTNKNLEEMVRQGKFRRDMYYRLGKAKVAIPPLRERTGDVSLLSEYFLKKAAPKKGFSKQAMEALENYHWPGNVRELKNTVEAIAASTEALVLDEHHAKPYLVDEIGEIIAEHSEEAKSKNNISCEKEVVNHTNRAEAIYSYIQEEGAVSQKEIMNKFRISKSTAKRSIAGLVGDDMLVSYKLGRDTMYENKTNDNNFIKYEGLSVAENVILNRIASNGLTSTTALAEHLKISQSSAYRYVRNLTKKGFLIWTRQGRKSHFELKINHIEPKKKRAHQGGWCQTDITGNVIPAPIREEQQIPPPWVGGTIVLDEEWDRAFFEGMMLSVARPKRAEYKEVKLNGRGLFKVLFGQQTQKKTEMPAQQHQPPITNLRELKPRKIRPIMKRVSEIKESRVRTIGQTEIEILKAAKKPVKMSNLLLRAKKTDKTTFRDNFVYPLINRGYLKRTNPDVPKIKKQRYVVTAKGKKLIDDMFVRAVKIW